MEQQKNTTEIVIMMQLYAKQVTDKKLLILHGREPKLTLGS